jgi:hypothetical protein
MTAVVWFGTMWTAVVVNSLRTGPLVGVSGTENLTVAELLTTLETTLVCVVVTTPPAKLFRSDAAKTDCGTLWRFSARVLPALVEERGREFMVEARERAVEEGLAGILIFFPTGTRGTAPQREEEAAREAEGGTRWSSRREE